MHKTVNRASQAGYNDVWYKCRQFRGMLVYVLFPCLLLIAVHQVMAADAPDPKKLEGRWQRIDGSYILEFSAPRFDGHLTALYFNPRPINVGQSMWKFKEGYLGVYVELRAPNYPGSTYRLFYDPDSDTLMGIYYQATMQQKFEVEFRRIPE